MGKKNKREVEVVKEGSNEVDPKIRLKAILEAKRIARSGLDNAYDQLEKLEKVRKRYLKERKDVSGLDIKITVLEEEINRIEEHAANMQYGEIGDGGHGFGFSSGDGRDAG